MLFRSRRTHKLCVRHALTNCAYDMPSQIVRTTPSQVVRTTCPHKLCVRHALTSCAYMPSQIVRTTCRHKLCIRHALTNCAYDMPSQIVHTTCPHKFSDSEFRETRLGGNQTSLAGVNESLPVLSAVQFRLCEIRYKRSAYKAAVRS